MKKKLKLCALLVLGLAVVPMKSFGVPCPTGQIGAFPSCVTSNLHKVLLLSGGESSDHSASTVNNVAYLRKLDSVNGIAVDYVNVKTTPSVISATNLAKYDVVLFFNVYQSITFLPVASQTLIQQWYEGGKGLGCFHQCVKLGVWAWYDSVMAVPYTTYAAAGVVGPVYVDSEAVGLIDSSIYKGQSFTWSDEWYDYAASPRGKPGVKIVATTRDAAFSGTFNSNAAMKLDHVVSWTHDFDGGRYYLNGLFHPTINQTGSPVGTGGQMNLSATAIALVNNQFLMSQRYLAGYTGCKDTSYWEYSPQATNQGANSCVTLHSSAAPTNIFAQEAFNGVKAGNFKVAISESGKHTVEIFDVRGKKLLSYHGTGPHEYTFPEIRQPGVYYLKVMTSHSKRPMNRRLFLL